MNWNEKDTKLNQNSPMETTARTERKHAYLIGSSRSDTIPRSWNFMKLFLHWRTHRHSTTRTKNLKSQKIIFTCCKNVESAVMHEIINTIFVGQFSRQKKAMKSPPGLDFINWFAPCTKLFALNAQFLRIFCWWCKSGVEWQRSELGAKQFIESTPG